ncbi:MAG: helix-turn-helix domain-containing protein [Rhodobacteraceae bacterium]|nr:helix-turn-helix domain-containing protein [Paracoccaceae bacterium]
MTRLDASLLKPVPPFSRMTTAQIKDVLALATARLAPAGEYIFDEGAEAASFHLLLDGHIQVERLNAEGDRVISLHIPPGQLFGIAKALGRTTYPASAVAAVDCVVLSWPMSQWSEFADRYDGFATETYSVIGARMAEMHNRIMELATQRVEQRIACALLRLSEKHGRQVEGGTEIAFPITRKVLSEMTGSTLHTVSRLLSAWERDEIVKSKRKHIFVLDPSRLEQLAQ